MQGAEQGTVVVAEMQTAGKGRRGRVWDSPAGDNIYMSMLLRPQLEPDKAPMLTLVMAYSVAKVMLGCGYQNVQIKWPNDLILSGKKVCGILTEMYIKDAGIDYVVIGVGVNVNTEEFSEELADKATSLYLETGRRQEKDSLIEQIVVTFEEMYEQFLREKDVSFIRESYNELLVNRGNEVKVLEDENAYVAAALGINSKGELLVRDADGKERAIFSGEVSVRGVYGYV